LDNKTITVGSISRKEVSERISKRLCRFCGEKWDKNHINKCKVWGKLNAIFVSQDQLEEKDASDKDEEMDLITHNLKLLHESPVHVSLHALQGVAGESTLQLTGMIKKQRVAFLMDTGNTHNFISAKWMKSLGLKTVFINGFSVIVTSDRQLRITKQCLGVDWQFHNQSFQTGFLVLPNTNFGVTLGMQWFQTLGEIVWNCAQLTMSFNHKGDKVTLVGVKQQNNNVQISSKVKPAEGQPTLLAIQGATTFQIASHSQFLHLSAQQ